MAQAVNSGADFQIRNITVNDTTDTPIDFDQRTNSVIIRCRDTSIDLQLREDIDESIYWTIPGGASFTLDVSSRRPDKTAFFIRSASGTPIVEAIGTII